MVSFPVVPPVGEGRAAAVAAAIPAPMGGLGKEAPAAAAAIVPPPPPCSPGLVAPSDCAAKDKAGEVAADKLEGGEAACNPAMWAVRPSMSLLNCSIS